MKGSNMDEKVKTINAILMDAVEEVVPTVERPRREWISDTNVSEEMNRKYKKLCNETRTSARKDKQEWLEQQCKNIEQCAGERKSREVYKLVKSVNRKWQSKTTAVKDKNEKILMDKEEIKER